MAVVGAWAWAAAGGLDFEAEADDFWDALAVVGSAGDMPPMDRMAIHRIDPLQGGTIGGHRMVNGVFTRKTK
jgi:hypothetical protein